MVLSRSRLSVGLCIGSGELMQPGYFPPDAKAAISVAT